MDLLDGIMVPIPAQPSSAEGVAAADGIGDHPAGGEAPHERPRPGSLALQSSVSVTRSGLRSASIADAALCGRRSRTGGCGSVLRPSRGRPVAEPPPFPTGTLLVMGSAPRAAAPKCRRGGGEGTTSTGGPRCDSRSPRSASTSPRACSRCTAPTRNAGPCSGAGWRARRCSSCSPARRPAWPGGVRRGPPLGARAEPSSATPSG